MNEWRLAWCFYRLVVIGMFGGGGGAYRLKSDDITSVACFTDGDRELSCIIDRQNTQTVLI